MKRSSLKINPLKLTYQQFIQMKKNLTGLNLESKYTILEKLGEGAFGSVWKAINTSNQNIVAIKVLDLQAVQKETSTHKKAILKRLIKSQAQMMTICQSPNVVKCLEVYESDSLKIMVIEYCSGKDLETEITQKKFLSEEDSVLILKHILNGLAELHRNGIIHRDLKAQNILMHQGIYKIADFGFSKQLPSNQTFNEVKHTKLGTIYTMAPQVLKGAKYGLQADIWSVGVIFYFMLYGKTPYEQNTYEKVLKEIQKKKIFSIKHKNPKFKLSEQAKSFIEKCLTVDSQKRLNWTNIASHELLKKYEKQVSLKGSNRKALALNIQFKQLKIEYSPIIKTIQDKKTTESRQSKKQDLRSTKKQDQRSSRKQDLSSSKKQDGQITEVTTPKLKRDEKKASSCFTDWPFQWSKEAQFQCELIEFILTQIAEKLQNSLKSHEQKRQVIETIYLVYARCFLDMSNLLVAAESSENNRIYSTLIQRIQRIHKESQQKFTKYSQKLTKKQSELIQSIQDKLISLIGCKNLEQKDIFLIGIQLPKNRINQLFDYTRQQQINFTQNSLNEIKNLLISSKVYHQNLMKYLRNYHKICKLNLEEVQQQQNLKHFILTNLCNQ